MPKPILLLDFDGVCHSYTSGWKGADVILDPPVPGLFEFLEAAALHFDVQIYSSRSGQPGGREAMLDWFLHHGDAWARENDLKSGPLVPTFPESKPPAFLTIDDRAICFQGVWPDPGELRKFQPWNKKAI